MSINNLRNNPIQADDWEDIKTYYSRREAEIQREEKRLALWDSLGKIFVYIAIAALITWFWWALLDYFLG